MSEVKMLGLSKMEYKGFYGDITYDMKTNTYFGKVTNYSIECLAKTIYTLKEAFAKAVDEYLKSEAFVFS